MNKLINNIFCIKISRVNIVFGARVCVFARRIYMQDRAPPAATPYTSKPCVWGKLFMWVFVSAKLGALSENLPSLG